MIEIEVKYEVIWPFIKSGAIQRAGLRPKLSEKIKPYLKEKIFLEYFGKEVKEASLLVLLRDLAIWLENEHVEVNLKKEYFGNAQKFINLTFKAMWMCNWLGNAPPHFPVDRIIQKAIETGQPYHKPFTWTDMNEETYFQLIRAPKRCGSKGAYGSCELDNLAEWELRTYAILMTV